MDKFFSVLSYEQCDDYIKFITPPGHRPTNTYFCMFHLRLARAVTRLSKMRPSRGTATYQYRMYGDADGPNYHLVQYLTQGAFISYWNNHVRFFLLIIEMQREEVSGANVFKMRAFATAIKTIHELDFPIMKSTQVKDVGVTMIVASGYSCYLFIRYLELGKGFHAE